MLHAYAVCMQTLKPSFSSMPLILTCSDYIGSTNPKKNPLALDALRWKTKPPTKKKKKKMFKHFWTNFFSNVFKFTWKMRYVLNRKKNLIFRFFRFYFLSYGHFYDVITPIFNEFFIITWKIKIGEFIYYFFSSYSAHSASFMKVGSKLRGGRSLLVVSWDRGLIAHLFCKFDYLWTIFFGRWHAWKFWCVTRKL